MGDRADAVKSITPRPARRRRAVAGLALAGVMSALAASWAGGAAAGSARDGEPDFITIGTGGFDVLDNETAGLFEFQARLNNRFWIFKPQAGLFVTTDQAFFGYGGILIDVFLGRRLVLSPSFAIGAHSDGEGKELGSTIEFRSAMELAYRFDDRSRLGLQFGHISNAGITDQNPGTEFLLLNYSIPTDVFTR